ncbi:hypothetical protein FA15DRAFT_564806, partial [Coprinopsis marcescibilis]
VHSARKMILRVVNTIGAKMELGAPMASLYLLQNPDHYTSHSFVTFSWKPFVVHIQNDVQLLQECQEKSEDSVKESPDLEFSRNVRLLDTHHTCVSDVQIKGHINNEDNVRIQRASNFYIGRSSVDDYVYRPVQHEPVCPYEGIQCAVHCSHGQTRSDLSFFHYLDEHPLAQTHKVACNPQRRSCIVPNLIGPQLPRVDYRDPEDFHCTMLTLFKPWRNGTDLKTHTSTWKAAFNSFEFTKRHLELIRNFNIQFECYDARDDYHAQRRADEATVGQNDSWDGQEYDDSTTRSDADDKYWLPKGIKGSWAKGQDDHMDDVSASLLHAGWKIGGQVGRVQFGELLEVEHDMGATYWDNIIKDAKKQLWKDKYNSMDGLLSQQDVKPSNSIIRDEVYLVNGSFFRYDFIPPNKDWIYVMDKLVSDSKLNADQERAFRIVGNHACATAPDQLLMYMGGMAGSGKTRVINTLVSFFNERCEPYRLVLLGPTGTSAALIGGSTYHSFLCLSSGAFGGMRSSMVSIEDVHD